MKTGFWDDKEGRDKLQRLEKEIESKETAGTRITHNQFEGKIGRLQIMLCNNIETIILRRGGEIEEFTELDESAIDQKNNQENNQEKIQNIIKELKSILFNLYYEFVEDEIKPELNDMDPKPVIRHIRNIRNDKTLSEDIKKNLVPICFKIFIERFSTMTYCISDIVRTALHEICEDIQKLDIEIENRQNRQNRQKEIYDETKSSEITTRQTDEEEIISPKRSKPETNSPSKSSLISSSASDEMDSQVRVGEVSKNIEEIHARAGREIQL